MRRVSLEEAKREFDAIVFRALADAEPTVVDNPSGDNVVILPLRDFEAWRETAYLLRTPANAAHLSRSIAEAETGTV